MKTIYVSENYIEGYEKLIKLLRNEMTIKELEHKTNLKASVIQEMLKRFKERGILKKIETGKKAKRYILKEEVQLEICNRRVKKKNNIDFNNIADVLKTNFKNKQVTRDELINFGAKIDYPYSIKVLMYNVQKAGIEVKGGDKV